MNKAVCKKCTFARWAPIKRGQLDEKVVVRKFRTTTKDIIPLNVIPIGVPTAEDKPINKYKEENIHWEKW
jgi:hypothetical protein